MSITFKQWLEEQRHTTLESGVLARDVAADPDWPDSDDLEDLVLYLDWKGASDEAVARLRYVHVLYEVDAG
ncbi:YozE family protein [Streptomyces sp. NBC_01142]|uniref:YozE family protein n=1 Tax=Streptomyces sp. NBC_01142 TaxID=2975865 RepID=UPI00224C7E6B|nr:YozE family protein [Streptomyces sp. NBC_01142]MCX4826597.1 YozE family protein [Streptomyces sp. NBC_01142]